MKKTANTIKRNKLYRIGCPSYIIPDCIVPNVEKAAPYVDDIELLLFESDHSLEFNNLKIMDELVALAKTYSITYTVHCPIDLPVQYGKNSDNSLYYKQIARIFEITKVLQPFALILHLDGIGSSPTQQDLYQWVDSCGTLCHDIATIPHVEVEKICLENLHFPIEWYIDFIDMFGFSLCLDFGHLLKNHENVHTIMDKYLSQTRVIHLHGIHKNRDHNSLKYNNIHDLSIILSRLEEQFKGVVTLEIFEWKAVVESLHIIEQIQKQQRKRVIQ